MIVIYTYQNLVGFSFWNEAIDMGGIANFHLIFNIVSTLILLPATGFLEKLTLLTIRDKKKENDDDDDTNEYLAILNVLDERIANLPRIAIVNSLKVILKMGEVSEKNFRRAMQLVDKFDTKKLEHIQEREDVVDKMDVAVANFLVKVGSLEITEQENKMVTTLLKVESEFEKIADYSYKLSKLIENMYEQGYKFSQDADKEIKIMYNMVEDTLIKTINAIKEKNVDAIIEIEALKEISEEYKEKYKMEHIQRLKEDRCSVETGITFIEILAVCEKIIGHCLNISASTVNYITDEEYITKHEYFNMLYERDEKAIKIKIEEFIKKYEMLAKDDKLSIC